MKNLLLLLALLTTAQVSAISKNEMQELINKYGIEELIKIMRQEVAKNIPMKMSDILSIEKVMSHGKTITYIAQFDYNDEDYKFALIEVGISGEEQVESLVVHANNYICSEPSLALLVDSGAVIKYTYLLNDGTFVTRVTIENC